MSPRAWNYSITTCLGETKLQVNNNNRCYVVLLVDKFYHVSHVCLVLNLPNLTDINAAVIYFNVLHLKYLF